MKGRNNNYLPVPGNHQPVPYGLSGQMASPRASSASDDNARIDMASIWETVKRGKWIILVTCVLVTGAVTAYTLTLPPVYEARSIVAVEQEANIPTNVIMPSQGYNIVSEVGELTYSASLARSVAEGVMETAAATEAEFPILYDEEGEERSLGGVTAELRGRMEFNPVEMGNMISIQAESGMPSEAALIANLYAEEYQNYRRARSRASIAAVRNFLETQVENQEQELAEMNRQWERFARSNEVVTQGPGGERLVQQYSSLLSQRNSLDLQLEQARAGLEFSERRLEDVQPESLRGNVVQEQELNSVRAEIESINQELSELNRRAEEFYINYPDLRGDEQRIAEEFPRLQALSRQIAGLEERRTALASSLADVVVQESTGSPSSRGGLEYLSGLQADIAEEQATITTLEGQISDLDARLDSYQGRLNSIPRQQVESQQLERDLGLKRQFLTLYMQELQRTRISEEAELGNVNIVRNAREPVSPVSPDLQQNIVLGLLLGLGLGIGLTFVRQAAANQFRRPEDVQEEGYSLVGVIPRMDREIKAAFKGKETVEVDGHEVSTRLLPMHNPWSPISENYRLVRTNLQYAGGDGVAPQVLLITSPEPADGKTLTAINLAITVAQSGRRTLLIDADLRRPAVHKLFDLPNEHGLADVLRDGEGADEHIRATKIEDLFFLSSGKTKFPPAEMLGSDLMRATLDGLRQEYDTIIVDSPPVLAVSDPVMLATQCDATLVVVSAERTEARALDVTRQTLQAVGVPIAGVIFNRFEAQSAGGYGYGYGYRYDYDEYTSGRALSKS